MKKEDETLSERLTLRLTPAERARIESDAAAEDRTPSNWLRHVLQQHWKGRKGGSRE